MAYISLLGFRNNEFVAFLLIKISQLMLTVEVLDHVLVHMQKHLAVTTDVIKKLLKELKENLSV